MQHGWPRKVNCASIQPYFRCKTDLEVEQGCLLRGHRVVIPTALRERLLHELHKGHFGIVKTKSLARGRFWWPQIDICIERCVGACSTCIALRPAPPRASPAPWPRPSAAWQRIHLDYLSIGQSVYLVVVDAYSKWLECLPMSKGTSTGQLIVQLKYLFSRHGLPTVIVSDNDVKIKTAEFHRFCTANGIEHVTSPIYHPASNGQAENSVRTCKKMIKCILSKGHARDIHERLLEYVFNYRNTQHCATGSTPAMLMYGREFRSRLDLLVPLARSERDHSGSYKSIKVDNNKVRNFKIGDKVWLKEFIGRKPVWVLGVVNRTIGRRMYLVSIVKSNENVKRHIDQLLKYTDNVKCTYAPTLSTLPSPPGPAPAAPVFLPSTSQTTSQMPINQDLGIVNEDFTDAMSDGEGGLMLRRMRISDTDCQGLLPRGM